MILSVEYLGIELKYIQIHIILYGNGMEIYSYHVYLIPRRIYVLYVSLHKRH